MNVAALRPLDSSNYVPHALHSASRTWAESNCYIDVWIEVLHVLGCDPHACLGFVLGLDWEGDQFTFFKPPHDDLTTLYGVDVQELTVYRSLAVNALEMLQRGKLVLAEADAFFLPDTTGTDYRRQHTKTTIGIQEMDLAARTLGYFHNGSYHVLGPDDFTSLFRIDAPPDPAFMPFFAEFVRTNRVVRMPATMLRHRSVELLAKHLARRPDDNPIVRFAAAFALELDRLQGEGLEGYHLYAFASIRQLGSAFELAALYLRWLSDLGEPGLDESACQFIAISNAAKSLILKGARTVATRKPVDVAPLLTEIERAWADGVGRLALHYGV